MNAQRFSKAIAYFVMLSFVLVSCTSAATVIPTNAVVPSVTFTQSPTDTPTPTIMPSSTPIPGPWYGIPITTENANQMKQLAIWGKGFPWTWRQTYGSTWYEPWYGYYPELTKMGLGNLWTLWATDYAVQDKVFVVQTTRGLYLYAAESGKETAVIDNAISYVISDDGNLIATGHNDAKVKLWNAMDGTLLAEFQYKLTKEKDQFSAGTSLIPAVSALAISHNGKMVAAGYADDYILVWSKGNRSPKLTIYTNPIPNWWGGIRALAFSPDDKSLFGNSNGGTFLWNTSDGKQILGFERGGWITPRPAFSPDGKLIASSSWDEFDVQDTTNGNLITKFKTGTPYVKFSVSPDWQNLIVDYLLENKREIRSLPNAKLIETTITPANVSLSLFDNGHLWGFRGAKVLPDKSLLVWGVTNEFIYWWKPSENQLYKYPQSYPKVFFAPTGKFAAGCQNGVIDIFTIDGLYKSMSLEGHNACDGIAFSLDEDMVTVWTKNRLTLVSIITAETKVIKGHPTQIMNVTFSPDGMQLATVTVSKPREIFIWDTKTTEQRLKITNTEDTFYNPRYDGNDPGFAEKYVLVFSSDGNILATRGTGNPVRLWNLADGTLIGKINAGARKIAFSPDGKILATANPAGIISLWQIPSGEKLTELRGHVHLFERITYVNDSIPFYSFPPDGLDILSVEHLEDNQSISSLQFLSDGTGLLSVGWDGTVRLWGVNPYETSIVPAPPISYPIFEFPSDLVIEIFDYNSTWKFKVYPIRNAEGYLWGFFQDDQMVWENMRDEGKLSGNEYTIPVGSVAHDKIKPGFLLISVRALINGQWTDQRVVSITLK